LCYNRRMQTVVVTGASSGIGRAAAIRFGRDGGSVLAVGRKAAALREVAREVQAAGGRCEPFEADVTAATAPGDIVAAAIAAFGGLTTVVNAAGIIASGTVESTSDAAWDDMIDVNLRAPFRLMRAAAPHLVASARAATPTPTASVVNVSSVTGLRAFPGVLAYCVSKAGVDQLTRCAALELAPQGVRVNAVNPGVVVTNLHRRSGMGRTVLRDLSRALETDAPARPSRRRRRNRGPDRVSRLRPGGLDYRGDDLDRRRPSPHLRPLAARDWGSGLPNVRSRGQVCKKALRRFGVRSAKRPIQGQTRCRRGTAKRQFADLTPESQRRPGTAKRRFADLTPGRSIDHSPFLMAST